jgi:hypothetical protein
MTYNTPNSLGLVQVEYDLLITEPDLAVGINTQDDKKC